jgi:hypothetical protein
MTTVTRTRQDSVTEAIYTYANVGEAWLAVADMVREYEDNGWKSDVNIALNRVILTRGFLVRVIKVGD